MRRYLVLNILLFDVLALLLIGREEAFIIPMFGYGVCLKLFHELPLIDKKTTGTVRLILSADMVYG